MRLRSGGGRTSGWVMLTARLLGGRIRAAFTGLLRRDPGRMQERYFDAFISYSHERDGRIAVALQHALHRFARPWYKLRALHVFRDDANLTANPNLWSSITSGLETARYLVLLTSPNAAASQWVNREVAHWLEHRPADRIILVLTDGELLWDDAGADFDRDRSTALPRALAGAFADEPRYVDLRFARDLEPLSTRNPQFREAVADIAAAIHERPKDELIGEDVRQFRRTRRIAWSAAITLLALAIAATVAAITAVSERNRAEEQLRLAVSRFITQEAAGALETQHSQSLLLALEALELSETAEARSLLFQALAIRPEILRFAQSEEGTPADVAFSPTGDTVAVRTDTGVVDFLDAATGGRVGEPVELEDTALLASALSPSGETLAAGSEAGYVHLFDSASREEEAELRPPRDFGGVVTVTFAGEDRIVAGYGTGGAVVWDADSGRVVSTLPAPGGVNGLSFSSRGQLLAVSWSGGTVDVWELQDPPELVEPIELGSTISQAVSFSPAGDRLAVGTIHGDVRFWDSADWAPLASPEQLPSAVSDLAFSADGETLAIAAIDTQVRLWDVRDGGWLRKPLRGHIGSVNAVSFAPTGLELASAGRDGNLILFDPARSDRLAEIIPAQVERFEPEMAFDPISGRIAWTGREGRLMLGELDETGSAAQASLSGTPQAISLPGRDPPVSSFTFAPGGAQLAVSTEARFPAAETVHLLSESGEPVGSPLRPPDAEAGWATSLAFSPEGGTLAAAGEGGLHLLDIDTGAWTGERLNANGSDVEFSPNGQRLAVPVGLKGEVALVDAETLNEVATVETGEFVYVWDVAFSPDGTTLAGGDDDGNIALWDADGGDPLGGALTTGDQTRLDALAFSPDGTLLAASDATSRLRIWDVDLRRPLAPPLTGAEPALADGGDLLATLWPARGIVLRDLDLDSLRETACALANRNLGEAEWDRFLGDVRDYEPTCPGLPRGQPAEPEKTIPGE